MNAYMVNEDNESFVVRAESMQGCLRIVEDAYIVERLHDLNADNRLLGKPENEKMSTDTEKEEREFYQSEIIRSCQLLGECRN